MILAYGGASDVRFIQFYRTAGLTLYALLKFIVRPTPRMYVPLKFIVRPTPRMYVPLKFIIRPTPLTKLKDCIGLKKRVAQSRNFAVERFRTPLRRKFLSR